MKNIFKKAWTFYKTPSKFWTIVNGLLNGFLIFSVICFWSLALTIVLNH